MDLTKLESIVASFAENSEKLTEESKNIVECFTKREELLEYIDECLLDYL